MTDRKLRTGLIRLASEMPKGSDERKHLLALLQEPINKVAINPETQQFTDWVMLNMKPWSEREMQVYLEKLLKRDPTPFTPAAPKRKPPMEVGDMVQPKPDKAPPQNQDVAEQFKYLPGTVEKVDKDFVLVKFENGQTARFSGTDTGASSGLYRYTPKDTYTDAPDAKKHVEFIYFSKPGEVEPYRKHVVKEYIDRGIERGEDRQSPYYSGYIIGFKEAKNGDVYATVMTQQRPYPVSISPKKGQLLYFGEMRKRPNWERDYEKDVAELVG